MSNFVDETPANIKELVKQAGDKTSWRNRVQAVNELGKWRCQQSKDVLWRLSVNDLVYDVREEAFRKLQAFGEKVFLGKKKKGHIIKDINKKVLRVRDSFKAEFTIEEFKEKFKQLLPEAYDVYQYEKGEKFEEWINNVLNSAPKKN
ncbi:HEAT repeat domain-containing protein [Paenibacillus wynnii]|uniref:HEAT repeat domain-containing protein n=1 Tax=Paenibacillus wynnii TaxID=268407 RepID=A0A098MEV5_9BACL|nr:HEAT repeat domain-containing protein [Paenibacillus wynnii]KGE20072.1 hypothetical protein PWYN_12535 [Paenibacillus wynnii]